MASTGNSVEDKAETTILYEGRTTHILDQVTMSTEDSDIRETLFDTSPILKIYMGILIPVIVIGNGLTIVSYFKYRWLRSKANTLVISLAVSDLLCAIAQGIFTYYFVEGLLLIRFRNPLLYHFVGFVLYLVIFSSSTHNVILGIDRFVAILFPFYYSQHMTGKAHAVLILALWLFNAIVIGLYSLCLYLVDIGLLIIDINLYFVYMDMAFYFLVCLCMVILNGKVTLTAIKLSKIMPISSEANSTTSSSGMKKPTTMFIKVVMVYITAWIPYYIVTIMVMAGIKIPRYEIVYLVCMMLGIANYGLNVFIYGISSKRFRLAYKRLICPYMSITEEETSIMTVTTTT